MCLQEYKLVSDTLFLAISYIDRFLSLQIVPRQQLQLVGVSCMLLAAKYEEIYAPQASTLIEISFFSPSHSRSSLVQGRRSDPSNLCK